MPANVKNSVHPKTKKGRHFQTVNNKNVKEIVLSPLKIRLSTNEPHNIFSGMVKATDYFFLDHLVWIALLRVGIPHLFMSRIVHSPIRKNKFIY